MTRLPRQIPRNSTAARVYCPGLGHVGLAFGLLALAGCGAFTNPDGSTADVTVSLVNVTPFTATLRVGAIAGEEGDVLEREIASGGSAEVAFTCVDEILLGDPFDPAASGGQVMVDGKAIPIETFSLVRGTAFECGEIVEIILSGSDADTFRVDVFALNIQ